VAIFIQISANKANFDDFFKDKKRVGPGEPPPLGRISACVITIIDLQQSSG
jgi:hypothetical protein